MNEPWQGDWQLAGGSVVGRHHRTAGRNNQDAYGCLAEPHCLVAVVCDGCGSGAHSEVGAGLAAPLLAHALARQVALMEAALTTQETVVAALEAVRQEMLATLAPLTHAMGDHSPTVATDYFLFT